MAALYTDEELRLKILALNEKLDASFTQGRMDTRMTEDEWRVSMAEIRKQRDYYLDLYKRQTGDDSLGTNITLLPANDWIC